MCKILLSVQLKFCLYVNLCNQQPEGFSCHFPLTPILHTSVATILISNATTINSFVCSLTLHK